LSADTRVLRRSLHDALPIFRTRGFDLDMRVPAIGDPLPEVMDEHAAAVIFGGPMSVNDDHPFLRAELKLIERLLDARTPYLGIRSEEHTSELQSRENLVCRL